MNRTQKARAEADRRAASERRKQQRAAKADAKRARRLERREQNWASGSEEFTGVS